MPLNRPTRCGFRRALVWVIAPAGICWAGRRLLGILSMALRRGKESARLCGRGFIDLLPDEVNRKSRFVQASMEHRKIPAGVRRKDTGQKRSGGDQSRQPSRQRRHFGGRVEAQAKTGLQDVQQFLDVAQLALQRLAVAGALAEQPVGQGQAQVAPRLWRPSGPGGTRCAGGSRCTSCAGCNRSTTAGAGRSGTAAASRCDRARRFRRDRRAGRPGARNAPVRRPPRRPAKAVLAADWPSRSRHPPGTRPPPGTDVASDAIAGSAARPPGAPSVPVPPAVPVRSRGPAAGGRTAS